MNIANQLIHASRSLANELRSLTFSDPVSHCYLTIDYASEGYESYLGHFCNEKKKVLFLGMNPGPYGMAQTGVPFGEVGAVKNWMKLYPQIHPPANEHPKRRIQGMNCPKSEVSGKRLWGFFAENFPDPKDFFREHFVINFCPLIWMKESGANLTPDKIRASEMIAVNHACQVHLHKIIEILEPKYLIGVGAYAEKQFNTACEALHYEAFVGRILHPSPASPAANRDWAKTAMNQLICQGIWK